MIGNNGDKGTEAERLESFAEYKKVPTVELQLYGSLQKDGRSTLLGYMLSESEQILLRLNPV